MEDVMKARRNKGGGSGQGGSSASSSRHRGDGGGDGGAFCSGMGGKIACAKDIASVLGHSELLHAKVVAGNAGAGAPESCVVCGITAGTLQCSACKRVAYCSAKHQKSHCTIRLFHTHRTHTHARGGTHGTQCTQHTRHIYNTRHACYVPWVGLTILCTFTHSLHPSARTPGKAHKVDCKRWKKEDGR